MTRRAKPKFKVDEVVMWIGGMQRPMPVQVRKVHSRDAFEPAYDVEPNPSDRPNWPSEIPESQLRPLVARERGH